MRIVRIIHGQDGYELSVESVPGWALALDWAADHACAATRHTLCNPPQWMWRVGPPPTDRDAYRWSLAGMLWDLGQWPGQLAHRLTTVEYLRPLSADEVAEHFPDARMEFLEAGDCTTEAERI